MATLKAGVAEVEITPPVGSWLCGYGFREGPSTGVHDPLFARALVLSDERSAWVVIAADLIGVSEALLNQVRERIGKRLGIPDHHILLNCSHSHAAPHTIRMLGLGQPNPEYERDLVRHITDCVEAACQQRVPVQLAFGVGQAELKCVRRNPHPDGVRLEPNEGAKPDQRVFIFQIGPIGGDPIAIVAAYAMHAVTLGPDNRLISADFPGAFSRELRRQTKAVPFFLQGCCGDLNPVRRGGFEEVEENGVRLAQAVLEALTHCHRVEPLPIGAKEVLIELPSLPPPPGWPMRLAHAEQRLQEAQETHAPEGTLEYWKGMIEYARLEAQWEYSPPPVPLRLTLLRFGEGVLLGLSAEPFQCYARDLTAQSPYPATLVLGYTNGCFGYLYAESDAPFGGYEVKVAHQFYAHPPLDPQEAEKRTREAAYRLLGILKPDWSPYPPSHAI